ncbi:MAG: hypothetical protein ACTSRU_16120, partial [Candidatus Hodarchaeales archaeon]
FITGSPDPKGTVPSEPLNTDIASGTTTSTSTTGISGTEEDVPVPLFSVVLALMVLPIWQKKKRK